MNTETVIDTRNVISASIRNNQGKFLDFYFSFRIPEEQIPEYRKDMANRDISNHRFIITQDEARFLFSGASFGPWFDDGMRAIRFTDTGIQVIPTFYAQQQDDYCRFQVVIRWTELMPLIKQALELPIDVSIEFAEIIRKSADIAKPLVKEVLDSDACAVVFDNENNGINEMLERVRNIARNSSRGQDDPIKVAFYKDSERSLYWNITREGNRVMNGGIIWHESSNSYSIHT